MRRLFLSLLFVSCAVAQDWTAINAETLQHYITLVRTDTSNPPGNETQIVTFLRGLLVKEGIPVQLVGADPNRQNLIARLKGTGAKKPLLIMGHTDVVPVQPERWTETPFGAVRKDGFIWGRGTLDDKDNLVAGVMTMLLLKRQNIPLDRDVILVAEADEEMGGPLGMQYLIKNNWPDIQAEFCLAEGGKFNSRAGRITHQNVQLGEKMPRQMRLVVQGTAGHGSQPRLDNPVVRLAMAVGRIGQWQPPMRLNDLTRTYFERLSMVLPPEDAARFKALFDSTKTQEVQEYLRKNDIYHNSVLRTTISPNVFKAGFKDNVIPSEASATLDIRALPDEDMEKFKAEMARVIDDPGVKIEATGTQALPSPSARIDTELFRTLEFVQKRLFPGTVTIPSMATGATDMRGLRTKNIECYGIGSEQPEEDLVLHATHSDNERIKESALYDFVRYEYEVVKKFAGR